MAEIPCIKALMLIIEGSEETELTELANLLRRGRIYVTVAELERNECLKDSRNVKTCPNVAFSDVKDNDYDIVVLPGGPGTQKLKASQEVKELLQKQEMNDRWIAAICDAPTVLKAHGIGKGKTVTSFPDVKDEMTKDGDYRYSEESVVVDGKLITSRSLDPETAFYLGLTIIEELVGTGTRDRVAQGFL